MIKLKRIYEDPSPDDGYRVLTDRLWPRGLSKKDAEIDEWLKEEAPSDGLRKWFHDHPNRWGEFRQRYLIELKDKREELRELAEKAKYDTVTLLYASKDEEQNNAVVLKQYLRMLNAEL
ncbi:MAG: DUF488 domain-containing protein [Bacteroidales bacterium]|nr:DUF488 domain-containing protein [Bacteroidales bacterium]MCF8350058.1 DUF488 domain-containing protein [Bacteroidales bacterium]MCF8374998.1 DUF488 domain-containing protein [Bacteroidales bacterium]